MSKSLILSEDNFIRLIQKLVNEEGETEKLKPSPFEIFMDQQSGFVKDRPDRFVNFAYRLVKRGKNPRMKNSVVACYLYQLKNRKDVEIRMLFDYVSALRKENKSIIDNIHNIIGTHIKRMGDPKSSTPSKFLLTDTVSEDVAKELVKLFNQLVA
jgi:hypothetical protein